MYASIKREAEKLGLSGDVICYQGALTKNTVTGEVSNYYDVSKELTVEYIRFMTEHGGVPQLYIDDVLYTEKKNRYTDEYSKFCSVPAYETGDIAKFMKGCDKPVYKVYCYVPERKCAALRALAAERFGDRLLINSSKPWNVEAVNIKTSKGVALSAYCERLGIGLNEVMSFGDNLNDIQLITAAGFGVAVGNAVSELKEVANYVAESCENDGVAKAIEKFCFEV
jgi:Predicted hydrolases of the HAD superfamily